MEKGPWVLIVDDVRDDLQHLMSALYSEGYRVMCALNGAEALDCLRTQVPDIILMDAVMPVMDGFEACRQIKAHPAWVEIPVIFMTGLRESEYVVEGFAAGGIDYITKPLKLSEVLARLKAHLNNSVSKRIALERMRQTPTTLDDEQVQDVMFSRFLLTPREFEVLKWVTFGKTNRDIAEILNLSSRTVDKHLEHAYIKLGVETRAAAASIMNTIRKG